MASAERSFSKLKLVKNYLRSHMSQERYYWIRLILTSSSTTLRLDMFEEIFKAQVIKMETFHQHHGELRDPLTHLTTISLVEWQCNQKACNPNQCNPVSMGTNSCQHHQCRGDSQEECSCNRCLVLSLALYNQHRLH